MYIQPINSTITQTNFQAKGLNLRVRPRTQKLASQTVANKVVLHLTALTKYIIDRSKKPSYKVVQDNIPSLQTVNIINPQTPNKTSFNRLF